MDDSPNWRARGGIIHELPYWQPYEKKLINRTLPDAGAIPRLRVVDLSLVRPHCMQVLTDQPSQLTKLHPPHLLRVTA